MERKTKIMQIIPNLAIGGAEVMVENLSLALSKNKYDVSIVSLYDYRSALTERLENRNINIYYMGKQKGLDVKIIIRLYKLFKQEKPDVVHTHLYSMPYVTPAAILAKVPIRIHTIHSIANKEVGYLKRKINKFFYKFCGVVPVSISPSVKQSVIKEYKMLEAKTPIIYNGIALEKCLPKINYDIDEKVRIIHVGSFKDAKNHLGLIDSFKIIHDHFPNSSLQLIGTGKLEKIAKQQVENLKLADCVEFVGLKSNVYPYLNKADVFALPSIWEGMPISLIEAMATGLPIVATKVGGIPDIIEDNVTGLLVNIDEYELAEAILRLIKDRNLRQRLGTSAKKKSKQYSSQEMASEYSKLYEHFR